MKSKDIVLLLTISLFFYIGLINISFATEEVDDLDSMLKTNPQAVSTPNLASDPATSKQYWNQLSDNQINDLYENHMDNFGDKFSEDWGKKGVNVDPPTGSRYDSNNKQLTFPDNTKVNLDTMQGRNIEFREGKVFIDGDQYSNAQNIQGNPDGSITASSADFIQSDRTGIWNGEGIIIYPSGDIYIQRADVIDRGTTLVYDVDVYNQTGIRFYVESADNVTSDCIVFGNVSQTTFYITNNFAQAASIDNISITDCYDIYSSVEPILNGSITISKTSAKYILENATLKIANEILVSNNTAVVNVDINGISCMQINPPATYYKTYNDIRKDFAIYIYQEPYKLCFEKTAEDGMIIPTTQSNYGLINFITNTLYLNGKAQYLRYPFKESITEVNFRSVYDGQKADAKTIINLDTASLSITSLSIEQSEGLRSISSPAEYITLIEEDTTTWANLSHKEIESTNIANFYIDALLAANIMRTGWHEIYPYSEAFIISYIHNLEEEENTILGVST